ncbi:pantoate--beta-alanine ligase [candidate division KSB1 bacterium]
MEIFQKVKDVKVYVARLKAAQKKIGFVPTMGALHDGHTSLIHESIRNNDITICSIFINPIQFNNKEDLAKYPKLIKDDIAKLNETECDCLFNPDGNEIYPKPIKTEYDFGHLDKVMEGKYRKGHFNGVAVVVKRLFDIIEPDNSYFGEKDYQQLMIIKHLVKDQELDVNIIPCPIVREVNGLAMSSRNSRLDPLEKVVAPALYAVLKKAKERAGDLTVKELKSFVTKQLGNFKIIRVEYFDIVDMNTLEPVHDWSESKEVIACIAAYVGNIRLIDNIILFS